MSQTEGPFQKSKYKISLRDVTHIPVVSIRKPDRVVFANVTRSNADVSLVFDRLDRLLQPASALFHVDCNYRQAIISNGCGLNLFEPSDIYLGCGGLQKRDVKVRLTCRDSGLACAELRRLEEQKKLAARDECSGQIVIYYT